jgi:hypothetical protein
VIEILWVSNDLDALLDATVRLANTVVYHASSVSRFRNSLRLAGLNQSSSAPHCDDEVDGGVDCLEHGQKNGTKSLSLVSITLKVICSAWELESR